MQKLVRPWLFFILLLFTFQSICSGQGGQKVFNETHNRYFDSLKKADYPYALPILGKGAYKRGYDLPYAYGLSAIYFTQRQEINITSTQVGLNGGELIDVSQLIRFGPTIATTNAVTIRPDIWVLPFLNVYGIIGGGTTQTDVNLVAPAEFSTSQRFNAESFGLGATLTGAVGPVWIAWDNNYNFVDVDVVVEPVPAFNSSLRVGLSFPDYKKPDRSLQIWTGTFYQIIQSDTRGSLPVTEIFPNFGEGLVFDRLYEWADQLPPPQRLIARQIIGELEKAAENIPTDSEIDYLIQKEVAAPFNLIFGAQYQFNKNWMLRTEMGVFGKRSQFLLNLNWRFPGFKSTR
ncbi:hypothetical protein [Algoriphagus sediminis]|uniref:Transporter n=1 Tax=Algoriphagus sediminis TaxID=3057113 RepID=A0ABT7YEN1_9BACT|nr:hypothetical protein [Algoriphagus sediminis]MDN3204795.1 hypothetical protein [Algoriphagus sediminis]